MPDVSVASVGCKGRPGRQLLGSRLQRPSIRVLLCLALVAILRSLCAHLSCDVLLSAFVNVPGSESSDSPADARTRGRGDVQMRAVGASSSPLPPSSSRIDSEQPPDTESAPPDSDSAPQSGRSKAWTECLLEYSDGQAAEVWVFRQLHNAEFQRLLHLRLTRGYPPGSSEVMDRPIDFSEYDVEVGCRERAIDPDLLCAQCVRILTGGAYGNGGISVPAYPPKKNIMECLEMSRIQEVVQGQREDGSPLKTRLSETAFCNSVNVAP
mmetsp:Transcript_64072/g.152807  ORF Transcript_64072/g.152807 Transcript_64072/m.152807 type:complete len:267 (-) Transcript_64072:156-956(-)